MKRKSKGIIKCIMTLVLTIAMVLGAMPVDGLVMVAHAADIALSGSDNYTVQDGDVLTGSTSGTVTIANNAKITLSDVTINGGIILEGSAEITLVGTNSVSGATNMAGIQVGGSGTTLTIKGNGSLAANGANNSAGIGLSRAWKVDATGGDIVIEGGNITATGKGMGAGIGTGVSFGDDANHTATIGNITIKGGTVTAIGGTNQYFPGSGIGKGGAYSYGNTVIGTVTITTDIDLVDASSISEIVTYKHGETDVTSIASDYFTINEDGNRRIIVPKDDIDYNVTIDEEITGGTVTADKTTAKAGELVALTVTPESGYVLQSLTVKDASDNDVSLSNREFVMPRGGVTVSATFIQTTAAFDEATGVLTLNGNVDADEVKAYGAIIGDYGAIVKESPVTSVVCEPGTVLPADCSELFLNYTNLITIDLSNADISGVTNMSKMFGSRSLTTIYVNSAWSMENVTSSDQMFYGCNLLRGGNGSRWEDVRVAVWESNGNDLEAAKAKASRSSYAIIDGKGGLPGYLTVKPKQTPSAPTANVITYTGEAQELVSAGDGTMLYSLDDGIYSAEIPTATAAGTYTVHYKVDGSDNWNAVIAQTVEVTIAKATPTVTAPTANTLTYNGNEQELVTAGSTDFGTVLYSLDGETYSEEIPKGTDAKTYTVYYKVEGSDNWNAVDAAMVEATIAKVTPTVTAPTANTLTYNGNEQELVTAGYTDFGKVLYSLDGVTYSEEIPKGTDAGTYTVYYKVEGSDNWNAVAAQTIEVTIRGESTEPVFSQHALLLSDEIGVQFYVSFPDGFDATGCYVDFAAADGRSSTMQYADAVSLEGNSNVRYFSFNINALELAENITATLHYGENATVVDQYSAMTYIQAVQADTSADDNLKNLVNALQSYGYYMQQSGWTDDKASHTAIPVPTDGLTPVQVTAAQTAVSGMNKTVTGNGLADTKVSLTLNAKTMINVYVKPKEGVTIQSSGCTTETIGGETYYKFTTDKIGPKNLATPYSVTVETSSGTATVSASAMSYVNAAFSSNTLSEAQQKALAAYYYYYYYATQYN